MEERSSTNLTDGNGFWKGQAYVFGQAGATSQPGKHWCVVRPPCHYLNVSGWLEVTGKTCKWMHVMPSQMLAHEQTSAGAVFTFIT